MADGEKKQPLSLNQLHNRFLLERSASLSNHKPVSSHYSSFRGKVSVGDGSRTLSKVGFDKVALSVEENGIGPRFALESPPSVQEKVMSTGDDNDIGNQLGAKLGKLSLSVEESEDEHENWIKRNISNSTSIPVVSTSSKPHESNFSPEADDYSDWIDANILNACDYNTQIPGEKPIKLKLEGRRRLCKISWQDDNDTSADKKHVKSRDAKYDGISDFDSPTQSNNGCEGNGNKIRDILDDLNSRLEALSIEKKKVPLINADHAKNFPELVSGKFYDLRVKEDVPKYKSDSTSSLLSTNYVHNFYKESNAGDALRNEHQKGKTSSEQVDCDGSVTMRESVTPHFKSGKEECNLETDIQVNTRKGAETVVENQGKIIQLFDDEFDLATMSNDDKDDLTLSDLKCTYKLPGKIANMLFPHQREGLKWLLSLHSKGKGGILGDDMGLGKTMQICSFIAGLFYSSLIKRVLIVAPKTLLTHWIKELSTVGLSEKTREYFATCAKTRHYELQYVLQDKGVLLTTYDIVRNNVKSICGDCHYHIDGEEDEATWDYIILDEGHLIKNPSTQRAKSLHQIPCRHRIIISGTPLQNNLKELWALFNFCCPELLGDKKEFKEKYENFINRGNEKNATDREKRIGSSKAKDLRDCIQPYFLRRMKSDVFIDDSTLSKKSEVVIWLKLTTCQRQLYEAFLNSEVVVSAFDGSPLAALTILKKICDHPLLLTKRAAEDVLEGMDSIVNQEDHIVAEKLAMHIADVAERFDFVEKQDLSCKILFILALLRDLIPKGHKVLIFSQTRKMLNLLQESLISNDYKYIRIDGTTKSCDRASLVKEFQEGHGAPIFLLTSQVGGLGLTLTNADRVIVVDPAWNPSTDNQSVDRAYRIGQKKDVIVYRLMTCGTVEEKIYRKQVFKGGLFRSATEHKEQTRYFSKEDLRDLFSLPKQGFGISLTQQQLLEEHDRHHTMEESLKAHVEFLETLNIAGVSQHSLLFSKTVPVQRVVVEEEEVGRLKAGTFSGNNSRISASEPDINWVDNAFNPKDAKKFQRNSSSDANKLSEIEIRDKINRLSHLFANKVVVANLSDKGEKLRKQIGALSSQLYELQMAKRNEDNVIELL